MSTILKIVVFVTVIVCTSAGALNKIFGGTPVDIASVPFMASLRLDFPLFISLTQHYCGAIIVHPQFLITAAHCIHPIYKHLFKIRVGTDLIDSEGQVRVIEKYFVHPKFNGDKSFDYDIAVIKLKTKLDFNDKVASIAMAAKDFKLKDGAMVKSMGFGKTEYSEVSKHLLEINLPVVNHNTCQSVLGTHITDRMICAGQSGKYTCTGDSGGPLVYKNVLVGVVSFGLLVCGAQGAPGVYASIPALREFIDTTIHENE